MPEGRAPDGSRGGPTVPAQLRAHMLASIARIVPPVFLALGVVYLSGSIFLPFTLRDRFADVAPWLALTCAGMGVGLLWFARATQRGRLPARQLQPVAGVVFAAISTQALLYQLLLPDQPTAPSIFMLVVGVGLVAVERRYYWPLAAFIIAEWALLPLLGHPVGMTQFSSLASATVVGVVSNELRRRGLVRDAQSALAFAERGKALEAALLEAHSAVDTLRVFSATTTEGIVIHRDGHLIEANDAFWSMFRLPPGSRAGDSMADRVAPESQELVARRMRDRVEGPAEVWMVRGDYTRFTAEVETRNIVHQGLPARIAIIRDMTHRKAAEADRRKAEEGDRLAFERLLEIQQLKRLDEFKTAFLNTASHELNTPITPVRLQLHLLKAGQFGPLSAEQAHSVDVIDRNIARLAALVQDLLDVARLQGGQMKLQRTPTDLQHLAEEAVDAYGPPAAAQGIELQVAPGPPRLIEADSRRLTQVLYNLLSNAVKFTPRGGRIEVRLEETPDRLRVAVRDTGAGLERGQIARLFQPFSQVHEDPAMRQAGTGLGLYICRGIVEAHSGRLWAESEGKGKGATFCFEVPKTLRREAATPASEE